MAQCVDGSLGLLFGVTVLLRSADQNGAVVLVLEKCAVLQGWDRTSGC